MDDTQGPATAATEIDEASGRLTDDERAAVKERARELKSAARRGPRGKKDEADGERELLAKIAEMAAPDRAIAERLHAIVRAAEPTLASTTWYGMPAYARDGKVVCFFQDAAKFKTRYATLGFSDRASLDADAMWPVAYALKDLTPAVEAAISALLKKAVS